MSFISELVTKLEAIFNSGSADDVKAKAEELYKFYTEVVLEELKSAYKQIINMKLNEELNDFKISVFEQEMKKAQIIMNKYEVLTREYQSQNKTFQERH